MIQANELRIGNWVDAGQLGYVQVATIDPTTGGYSSPIPLTPEILEKCGFKMGMSKGVSRLTDDLDYDPEQHGDTYYWDLKVPKNDHVQDLGTFNLVQFGKDNDILWAHQWLRVKLKSLHQLQNLYFSLTGTELTVNI